VQRWAAARDVATALYIWCDSKNPDNTCQSKHQHQGGAQQLLGGPRRFKLLRKGPDGDLEAFAAVATRDEAMALQPEYMQDKGYVMGA
jgi:hypothetical protein